MDAGEALDELTRLSGEIRRAAILDSSGVVLAATPGADRERLAQAALELLDVAAIVHPERDVEKVVVAVPAGAVVVVRSGAFSAVATTGPEPAAAVVAHDLRACLARLQPDLGSTVAPERVRRAVSVDA